MVGKDWQSCKSDEIGKVANQTKLAIPSHSEPLQWEKIEKL